MRLDSIYETVTRKIIRDLEVGVPVWIKPWKTDRKSVGGIMPHNVVTGRCYSGINVPILWHQADACGYPSHSWLTFKQAQEKGGSVRKGEKGTQVVFTKRITVEDDDKERLVSMLRTFVVFNRSQIDGLKEDTIGGAVEPLADPLLIAPNVDRFIKATGADIRHGGDRACFVPSKDFIALPPPSSFTSVESYLATALHECGHWAGHTTRLNRDLTGRFGTRAYAAEELIAELTAAFLCAHLGVAGELRHSEYIANWISLLTHDDRAIFTAASKASQAANYLRSFSEIVIEEALAA